MPHFFPSRAGFLCLPVATRVQKLCGCLVKEQITGVCMIDLGGISDSCHVNLLPFPITSIS